VPLLFPLPEAPEEYQKLFDEYWDQVEEHVRNLEKMDVPKKIYHEMVFSSGKDGLQAIKAQNERTYKFVKAKVGQGVVLEPLEEEKLFSEYLDWAMCLSVVRSSDVAKKVLEFYKDVEQRRDNYVVNKIDNTLKKGQAAMLLMRDENRIRVQPKFSKDINVFLVRPPALNDIHRWLRDYTAKVTEKANNKK
jgi:hypothetical protein